MSLFIFMFIFGGFSDPELGLSPFEIVELSLVNIGLAIFSAIPFILYYILSRRWSGGATITTALIFVGLISITLASLSTSSTAGIAFIFLPLYLFFAIPVGWLLWKFGSWLKQATRK